MPLRTITVGQLRRLLEHEDDDALVIVTADYGDYGHTQQALRLRGQAEQVTISPSAYSASGFAIDDEDNGSEETYLLLR